MEQEQQKPANSSIADKLKGVASSVGEVTLCAVGAALMTVAQGLQQFDMKMYQLDDRISLAIHPNDPGSEKIRADICSRREEIKRFSGAYTRFINNYNELYR